MLPDIPPLKQEISKALNAAFKSRVNAYMGALNESPRYYIKEGSRVMTIRPDGSNDETELKQASAETTVRFEEVPRLSFQDRLARLDEAAREMARQISEHAFGQINEAVERVGNIVKGEGRPLSPDTILAVYEKIHLDFDEAGNPSELTMVLAPGMAAQAKEALQKLHQDPEYSRRYREVIDRKRMEWRDREAARRLVG